jgi:hypothetical protein
VSEETNRPWFTTFNVEATDLADSEIIWSDAVVEPTVERVPTRTERYSILAVGGLALGGIVLMVVALIVGVYISRH